MNRYGTGIALVAVGGIVMTGALAADDAKELQAQLREAKATLSNYERGRYESPAVRAAKEKPGLTSAAVRAVCGAHEMYRPRRVISS